MLSKIAARASRILLEGNISSELACRSIGTRGMDIVKQMSEETTLPLTMGYQDRALLEEKGLNIIMREANGDTKKVLNFGSSDYLGLSTQPEITEALKKGVEKWGNTPGGTRVVTGTKDSHHELEQTIAKFHNLPSSVYYSSTTLASAGFFQTIFDDRDAILSDSLNHSSLVQAIRHCKARKFDFSDLEAKLQDAKDARARCIVTDGVFSLDGYIAPIDEIIRLAEQYDAMVLVDDCHATGCLGETGKGTDEYCGVYGHPLLMIATACGKAMGSPCGGYIAGPSEVTKKLRQISRTFLFSNPNPPFIAEATNTAFKLHMEKAPSLLPKLRHNLRYFIDGMQAKGFALMGDDDCAVKPMLVSGKGLSFAMQWTDELLATGYFATGCYFPAVPRDTERIRSCVNGDMTEEMIDEYIDVNYKMGLKHNLDFEANRQLNLRL